MADRVSRPSSTSCDVPRQPYGPHATACGRPLVVFGVDGHRCRGDGIVLLCPASIPVGEHIIEQQPMPIADRSALICPSLINRTMVGRLTPSRSAACCVVRVMLCGTTVTARPCDIASTTRLRTW